VEKPGSDRRRYEPSDAAPVSSFHVDTVELDAEPARQRLLELFPRRRAVGSRGFLAHLYQTVLPSYDSHALFSVSYMGNQSAGTETYRDDVPILEVHRSDAVVECILDRFVALLSANADHLAITNDSRQVSAADLLGPYSVITNKALGDTADDEIGLARLARRHDLPTGARAGTVRAAGCCFGRLPQVLRGADRAGAVDVYFQRRSTHAKGVAVPHDEVCVISGSDETNPRARVSEIDHPSEQRLDQVMGLCGSG